MVVFPAPSKPRIKILISLVPKRPEKRLEKKPPGETHGGDFFLVLGKEAFDL